MAMLADMLRAILSGKDPWKQGGDSLMEMMPPELGKADGSIVGAGEYMKNKDIGDCPNCITNDKGYIDPDQSNPFSKLLKQNQGEAGRGTIMGFLSNFLSPDPERNNPNKPVKGYGTVGGGDPSRGTPGSGVDPGLNPTSTKDQKVPAFAEKPGTPTPLPLADQPLAPAPIDYAMPAALNPQQIEELRSSLLTASGQMNVANPNSLMGRMASPNSQAEMRGQMSDAEDISNAVQPLQKGDRQ